MFRYIYILMLVVGMMGFSSIVYAATAPVLDCDAALKCVCESQNHIREVPCPTDVEPPFEIDDGKLVVDCSVDADIMCQNLDIECKRNETPNCLLTLPIELEFEDSGD